MTPQRTISTSSTFLGQSLAWASVILRPTDVKSLSDCAELAEIHSTRLATCDSRGKSLALNGVRCLDGTRIVPCNVSALLDQTMVPQSKIVKCWHLTHLNPTQPNPQWRRDGGVRRRQLPPGAGGEGAPPPRQKREHFLGEGDFVAML